MFLAGPGGVSAIGGASVSFAMLITPSAGQCGHHKPSVSTIVSVSSRTG
jgi:hypothetical protein